MFVRTYENMFYNLLWLSMSENVCKIPAFNVAQNKQNVINIFHLCVALKCIQPEEASENSWNPNNINTIRYNLMKFI